MEKLSMCRVCLATDVRLCSIASHLRDMFERISSMSFQREDRRPLVACYICHARLLNCYRLRTSCLQSDELLTDMLSSGEIKPQGVLSTNTFRVVSALHLSLGPTLRDSTECQISEDISDAEFDELYSEDITEAKEEQFELIEDNNESSHLKDPLEVIKAETDDVETDGEYLHLEEGNINLEEIGWESDTGTSSQIADNICPKIVKVVLERIDLNDSRVGAPVSKKSSIGALNDSKDSTTNKREIEVIENEQTETKIFKELKIVTKKIEVEKPVILSKISDKIDINLNKCDKIVLTSVVSDVCEKKFTIDTFLKQNVSSFSSIRKHSGEKPYQCNFCKKCFTLKGVLIKHIRTHSGDKPYQCNVCKKCFSNNYNLKIHNIRMHSSEKPYQCKVYKKCFGEKSDFRTHTSEKPYQCNVCEKCFTQKGYLKRHIFTHTGEKPYQCNVCKKCFRNNHNLKIHNIRIHSSEKPYHCNVCKKCFSEKNDLKRHFRTHASKKPYQCNVCEKYFNQKGDLKRHILIHTGEKPYQCNVCKKCFNRKGDLKIHIRTHTGEKPYQCNVCKKCFSDPSPYSKHIRIHKR